MSDNTTAEHTGRIVELLAAHPWVARARPAPGGGVLVVPHPAALAASPEPGPLLREHLDQWTEVYDWVYETAEGRHADDLDLSGWQASDTGAPLPEAHMRDWVDRTVDLVLAQRPGRLLELGCGTGLLAHRLHPHLDGYVGTDVAQVAVERLTAAGLPGTAFVRAAAHETAAPRVRETMDAVFGPGVLPDCVLFNSVTQCFPDLAYLAAVLHGALSAVADGGTVIVGDNRHSGLLLDHFERLERTRDPEADGTTVAARALAAAEADEELSFTPAAVAAAVRSQPRPVRMSIHARTMAEDTELTRYRYDIVLHVGPHADGPAPGHVRRTPWDGHRESDVPEALRGALAEGPVIVHGIPNALLVDAPGAVTPYALRAALEGVDAAVLLDAADPHLLAVAAPADRAPAATENLPAPAGPLAHEPFPLFVRRRLPEVLRDHLRRAEPGTTLPAITVVDVTGDGHA
ncbi:class I SAM-dependent methyltransferase [Streptomyces beigongshangae]|uniref:class I SAM-dependent methyltransferase n=1 Tax=Streptomyces beigongshangae TaxID=2841597 RepID=UPI001C851972|nr:class I SAM-dependent methyltransferase [Streptomyces sp. REN17]